MNITVKNIIELCDGILLCGDENLVCENFSNDTRTINHDDIYVGIKGGNFNGSDFYKEAFKKGAKACILESDTNIDEKEGTIILVKSSLEALAKIAEYKRSLYNIPVIAVTGSVGKTSTKDIIASVVSQKYYTLKTDKNFNNYIGLPLTILKLKNHEALVLEMGMDHFGEISYLSKIAKPDIALITNIGTSHIGNLGSKENILKAKLEILDGLKENGTLIINNDDALLSNSYSELSKRYNVVTFGINSESDIKASNIIIDDNISCDIFDTDNKIHVNLDIDNKEYVYNALSAYTVGKLLNVDLDKIKYGIENYELTNNRMEKIKFDNNITIISDCYNCSLEALKGSLEALSKVETRKVAILGDMKELGDYAETIHKEAGKLVYDNKIDLLITVGKYGKIIADEAMKYGIKDVYSFDNNKQVIDIITSILKPNDNVLIKASHAMNFIEIVNHLKETL